MLIVAYFVVVKENQREPCERITFYNSQTFRKYNKYNKAVIGI